MQLDVKIQSIDDKHVLVDLVIDINVKIDDSAVFSCATTQSVIFEMSGYTDEQSNQLKIASAKYSLRMHGS